MSSEETKTNIVRNFLLNSPPGEINDVFNDIRVILNDDALLQKIIPSIFREHNIKNFVVAEDTEEKIKTILTEYNEAGNSTYHDLAAEKSFKFDHVKHIITDVRPIKLDETEQELFRRSLHKAAYEYVEDHFSSGNASVMQSGNELMLVFVGTKFSPNNFWNGRWKSIYTFNKSESTLKGTSSIHVHYYEDGNVQLQNSNDISLTLSAESDTPKLISQIISSIKKSEEEQQRALNDSFLTLSDNTFKSLRRALPVTRNKIEWGKILSYKLGSEIGSK